VTGGDGRSIARLGSPRGPAIRAIDRPPVFDGRLDVALLLVCHQQVKLEGIEGACS
jgi:hypothetical protein